MSSRPARTGAREALRRQQPLEERAVALQGEAQVLGRHVLPATPLALEALALGREALGEALHDLRDELVGALDRLARAVDEACLDVLPGALELGVVVALEQLRRVVAARDVGRAVVGFGAAGAVVRGARTVGALLVHARRRVAVVVHARLRVAVVVHARFVHAGGVGSREVAGAERLLGLHRETSWISGSRAGRSSNSENSAR